MDISRHLSAKFASRRREETCRPDAHSDRNRTVELLPCGGTFLASLQRMLHGLKSRRRGQRGFTLLELMVTVAIIGILVAIAVAVYEDYRKRGYEASAITYMRSWVPAQEVYLQKYGRYADADEDLAQNDLGILFVPDDIPYDFSLDNNSSQTEKWFGRAAPQTSGLAHLYVDQTGVVLKSMSGPPSP